MSNMFAISVLARQDIVTEEGKLLQGVTPKRIIVGSGTRQHFDAVLEKTPEKYKKTVAGWLATFLEQPIKRARFQENHNAREYNVILLIEPVTVV